MVTGNNILLEIMRNMTLKTYVNFIAAFTSRK